MASFGRDSHANVSLFSGVRSEFLQTPKKWSKRAPNELQWCSKGPHGYLPSWEGLWESPTAKITTFLGLFHPFSLLVIAATGPGSQGASSRNVEPTPQWVAIN